MHDVYAYGVIAPSTLYELDQDFPPPSGYAEIAGIYASIGGEAATGAYVLGRLGVATKLGGNRLGDDDRAKRAIETLTAAGVDCSTISLDRHTATVTEVVFAARETRTVFGTYARLAADRSWDDPSRRDIQSSRIVCLDPFFGGASEQAARWCREAGVPYVTVDTSPDSIIARNAEILVVSEEFATRTLTAMDPPDVLAAYTAACGGLVILTRGGRNLLYGRRGEDAKKSAPFPVKVRDTTGAGDSFRAGIIYGTLQGYRDEQLIRTASAVAALVCLGIPGVLNSPTEEELNEFLTGQR